MASHPGPAVLLGGRQGGGPAVMGSSLSGPLKGSGVEEGTGTLPGPARASGRRRRERDGRVVPRVCDPWSSLWFRSRMRLIPSSEGVDIHG